MGNRYAFDRKCDYEALLAPVENWLPRRRQADTCATEWVVRFWLSTIVFLHDAAQVARLVVGRSPGESEELSLCH